MGQILFVLLIVRCILVTFGWRCYNFEHWWKPWANLAVLFAMFMCIVFLDYGYVAARCMHIPACIWMCVCVHNLSWSQCSPVIVGYYVVWRQLYTRKFIYALAQRERLRFKFRVTCVDVNECGLRNSIENVDTDSIEKWEWIALHFWER